MRLLVVDDESGKRERVVAFLRSLGIDEIDEARSFQSAMEQLQQTSYAWVILDMRLTSFDVSSGDDGGRPRNVGGEEILRKMTRNGIDAQVIVLTQYSVFREERSVVTLDALRSRLASKYGVFHSLVQFQHSNNTWQDRLSEALLGDKT